jgi:hypothetical protein
MWPGNTAPRFDGVIRVLSAHQPDHAASFFEPVVTWTLGWAQAERHMCALNQVLSDAQWWG